MHGGSRAGRWLGAAAVLAAACAGTPKPVDQLAASEASLRGAQELGAGQIPSATLEFKRAQEQMQQARDLMGKGDNEKARLMLARAKSDADLAIAQVRQQQARDEASKANEQLKSVQQQAQ